MFTEGNGDLQYFFRDLENKRVLVTGGANGIGRSIVMEFIRQKSNVAILDIDEMAGRKMIESFSNSKERVLFLKCDVTNKDMVEKCLRNIEKQFGGIEILVNNAGVTFTRPFELLTLEEWKRVIEINLTGVFLCSKLVVPYMLEKGSGCIIMISSGSAITGSGGSVAYAASKGGINSLVRALSRELAPRGIRVNGVAPRSIKGELLERLYSSEEIDAIKDKIPLNRLGTEEDVARVVLFLASELAGFVTGEVILVDGGRTFGS